MNILYLSCHEVLEYDEVKLFTEMGHNVFSMGVYQNSNKGGSLRGPIENLYQNEQLKAVSLQCSKENIHPELIDWANVIVVMHNPPIQDSRFSQAWIGNNWEKIKTKRVVWRSIGQSIPTIEEELKRYKDQGLQIVRYSPKESKIPNFAGEDAIIRFYKDPEEYKDWNGKNNMVVNFTQSLRVRGDHCGYSTIMTVMEGLNSRVYGVGNEDLGGFWGGCVSHDEQKQILRDARVYLYYGTAPASYTLSLMEAMMTGIPVVAAGKNFTQHLYQGQNTSEIEDIIQNGENGFVDNDTNRLRKYVERLLGDEPLAKKLGTAGRETAIKLWGKEKIRKEWEKFLNEKNKS